MAALSSRVKGYYLLPSPTILLQLIPFAIHQWLLVLELAWQPAFTATYCRLRGISLTTVWTSQANHVTPIVGETVRMCTFVFMFGHKPRNRNADASRHWRRSWIGWVDWPMNCCGTFPSCKLFQLGSGLDRTFQFAEPGHRNGMTDHVDSRSNGFAT